MEFWTDFDAGQRILTVMFGMILAGLSYVVYMDIRDAVKERHGE